MGILKNAKHEAFCQNMILHKDNQTKAYQEAGYSSSEDTARKAASRLMTNVDIKNRIDELRNETQEKDLITREGLIEEMNQLKLTANADNQLNIVAKVLEMQGKMIAAFTEKREIKADVEVRSPLADEIAELRAKRGK